jgi:hypothetical protein
MTQPIVAAAAAAVEHGAGEPVDSDAAVVVVAATR